MRTGRWQTHSEGRCETTGSARERSSGEFLTWPRKKMDEDAELQLALMLSLQQSDENTDPAALPSTGSAPVACQQGQPGGSPIPAADDDDTPVGRNVMPADSPHLQAPQKSNKRSHLGDAQPLQMKLPKAAKLNDASADSAEVFRQAVARRWGSYLVQMGERELASACVDARQASGQPMSAGERAQCLLSCQELLHSGALPSSPSGLHFSRQLTHLCSADGASQLEALLRPTVTAPIAPVDLAEPDPRDFAMSDAERGEATLREEAEQQAAAVKASEVVVPAASSAAAAAASSGAGAPAEDKPIKKKPKKRNRCECCRKKVGLLGFDCRCGGVFCGAHRMASAHSCTFEAQRKAEQKAQLQKNLDSAAANIDVEHRFEKI